MRTFLSLKLEGEHVLPNVEASQIEAFLDSEAALPLYEEINSQELLQKSIENVLTADYQINKPSMNELNTSSDESNCGENENRRVDFRVFLENISTVQRQVEDMRLSSSLPKCLLGEEGSKFDSIVSTVILELEKTLRNNARQSRISDFWTSNP